MNKTLQNLLASGAGLLVLVLVACGIKFLTTPEVKQPINITLPPAAQVEGGIGAASGDGTHLKKLTVNETLDVTGAFASGAATIAGAAAVSGAGTFGGTLNYLESTEALTTGNTSTAAESGKTYFLSGATSTQVLPATSSAVIGAKYRYVVAGSVTGNITIVTNNAGNIIHGTLIVAGAVVDCDAEDTITIVADGENVGDFVELITDGTNWYILGSGALTSAKMTCTAT